MEPNQGGLLRNFSGVLKRTVICSFLLGLSSGMTFADCSSDQNCASDLDLLLAAENNAFAENLQEISTGVSISVDGETIVGTPSRDDVNRKSDVELESVDIQVKFDGLGAERLLNVSTLPERRVHVPDVPIEFYGSWNYPDWINKAELRIYESEKLSANPAFNRAFDVVDMDRDGKTLWLPAGLDGEFYYSLRVYDAKGRFDETVPLPLVISENADGLPKFAIRGEGDGRGLIEERPDTNTPGLNESRIAVSNIPLHGGIVTVYGKNLPEGYKVSVMGRNVPVTSNNDFFVQNIMSPGEHVVDVRVENETGERGVEFERDINIPDNEWFYVGIADATFGRRLGKDSHLLAPVAVGEYDDVYSKGRLAFYVKGKIKGRYIITAALDTREEDLDTLFSNLDKKDPRQLLRRLDPDDYYPVYGDDSTLKEDAPTSGKFYVRIDRGKSHVMWGNFKTRIDGVELARYERGLYGAYADLSSEQVTSFSEPIARLEAFGAQPGTLPQRDEFLGTGGSVYFLKRQDINQGSEQVTIEIRNQTTGLVFERKLLVEGVDYTLDYVQGLIILTSPLASTTTVGSAVLPSGITTYDQFLVVNYEYTPSAGDVDGYSYGGRGEIWVADQFRFGITGFQENTGSANQTLFGADLTWRLSEHSYFQFEWARSEGNSFASVTSSDGGFIFNPISGDGVNGYADAWRSRVHLDMAELTSGAINGSIEAGYETREKGFNGPGRYTQTDEEIFDAVAEIKPNDKVTLSARYDEVQRADGVNKRDITGEIKTEVNSDYTVQLGATHSDSDGSLSSDGTGSRTDVGARITYNGFGEDKFYVFGQATVARDATRSRNDRVGVGLQKDITDKIRADGEVSFGTSGLGLLAALSYEPTTSDRYYIGYQMLPSTTGETLASYDPFGRDYGTFVSGVRHTMSDQMTAWSEHNYDLMGPSQGLLHAYGVDYSPDPLWKLSAGVEAGNISDDTNSDFERIAPSLGISYNEDGKEFSARVEARFEDSDDNTRDRITWLGEASVGLQYDEDWRFLAKVDAVISDSNEDSINNADYIEASIGFAYRPIEDDRLNALFKYTYLHDLPASEQVNSDNLNLGPKQRSHIVSADFIYDLNERLSVGAKYGIRVGEISASRTEADFTRSTAHLGILRTDYHVVKNWDILLEARVLKLSELEQVNFGALVGVYRHIGDNLKVGVGYNFGRFSDDLTDVTLDDSGVFVNVIGKF